MILHALSQILLSLSLLIYVFIPLVIIRFLLIRKERTISPEFWILICSISILLFILSYIVDFDIYLNSNFTIPLTLPFIGDLLTILILFLSYNHLAYYNTKNIQKTYHKHLGISVFFVVLTFVGSMITDIISNGPMFGVIIELRSPFLIRFIGYVTYFLGYAGFGIILINEFSKFSVTRSIKNSQPIISLFKYLIFTFWFWVVTLNIPNVFINLTGDELFKLIFPSIITIFGFLILILTLEFKK